MLSSRAWWLAASALLFLLLQGGLADGGGRAGASLNKLDKLPDSAEEPRFVVDSSSYRGGGGRVEEKWSTRLQRLGWSSSTPVLMEKLRRQLRPSGSGFWQPVFDTPPVYLLAERRPFGASAATDRRRLTFFLQAWSHIWRQCGSSLESITSSFGFLWSWRRRGGGVPTPSGFVPGGGDTVSELRARFGPDCNLRSCFRVLHAKSQELRCNFLFLESLSELCNATGVY